ncbi:MAG TPA: DNA gyrase subunit A [Firmicutes bacterium]|nr:DNA gyrase subunit A [Bacillota bacterium]
MKRSYIDYAMSVIVSRALPDVRDGLKPVQRRILYAMGELGMTPDKPYKKSARVVGEVLGKYHPHGDAAVYDAMVRMAQDFSTRYPLVDGHGNFGSIDGDAPAAMRYTEVRMSRLATEMLRDLDMDTVDWMPNFDESLREPVVLPSRFPNLLVNGSAGIAVGMATNIPPHNLSEVVKAIDMMIVNPQVTSLELMKAVKGPDFPTGGLVMGQHELLKAYTTGRGIITVRAVAKIEDGPHGKSRIVVTEIPYQVNKSSLITEIADLVKEKRIEGISDLRDETDKRGMRIIIELKKEAEPKVVLNQLYRHTSMQTSFGIILLALVDGKPQVLDLRGLISEYLRHQKEVVTRRTRFQLAKDEEKAHILEGLRIALDHIDEVINLIRASKDVPEAKAGLMTKFELSEKQAVAILDMRLQRLTNLERQKVEEDYSELLKEIEYLRAVLADERLVYDIIRKELSELEKKFGDERRTKIVDKEEEIEEIDLIPDEEVVVTVTRMGYVKRLPAGTYRAQRRGGKGILGLVTREEDLVESLIYTTTHHSLLFFTNRGRVYRLKVYEIPEAGRQAKGAALINLLDISHGEKIAAVIPISEEAAGDSFLFFATRRGIVKKTAIEEFRGIRRSGIVAINLEQGDEVVGVHLVREGQEVMLFTAGGIAIRFIESDVRSMGRAAMGVVGIRLEPGDELVAMDLVESGQQVLSVSAGGFGKRTHLEEYRVQSRGGKGIIGMKLSEGDRVTGFKSVSEGDDVLLMSSNGTVIRLSVSDIRVTGRAAKGVKLMKLGEGESIVAMAQIAAENGQYSTQTGQPSLEAADEAESSPDDRKE